ncbi:MAG: nucleotidyltransferase domain-containing protein [Betaproteobacteria bacterium]
MSASVRDLLAAIVSAARGQGMTRRALAARAGIRAETLSRMASRGTCDFATLARLAEAAGLRLGLQTDAGSREAGRDLVLGKSELIRTLARARGVRSVMLFGSAARGDEHAASDLDFLIDLAPGRSLLDAIGFAQDLESALGRPVDVVTREGGRGRVLASAERDAIRII